MSGELRGLKQTEFNGKLVEVLDYNNISKLYLVKLNEYEKVYVREHNLIEIEKILIKPEKRDLQSYEFNIGSPTPKNKTKKQKKKPREEPKEEEVCCICMETMVGNVTLKCNHEMCPNCFAQHSRVNNTCPLCREEFAPPPKTKTRISTNLSEHMINEVVDACLDSDEEVELDNKIVELVNNYTETKKIDLKATLYAHMTESARIMYEDIEEWYDENW